MAIIDKTINRCWRGFGEKEISFSTGGNVQFSTMEKSVAVPQKIEYRVTILMTQQPFFWLYT